MIKIEKTTVHGFEEAIRGMRNPMNSWDKSDSIFIESRFCDEDDIYDLSKICGGVAPVINKNDHKLMMNLAAGGPVHAKYRRMITVYADITAPLYWWKEFDTYKVGTVANSCSTMHKIHAKAFSLEDFSHEYLFYADSSGPFILKGTDVKIGGMELINLTINILNVYRNYFLKEEDPELKKLYWWQMIQLLPSSYDQKRTVMLNYEVLAGIYPVRKEHKLNEWRIFCKWIEQLPYSEIIVGEKEEKSR